MIIDADTHLFEPRDLWVTHTPSRQRDLALSIDTDALGYPWLTRRGQPFPGMVAWVGAPGDFAHLGDLRERARRGLPNVVAPYDEMPRDYCDPDARVARLDEWGVDEAVLFPQWGFMWESLVADDLETTRVNCAAWNRWSVEVAQSGRGRLHPVGHVSLQGDAEWVCEQLAVLSAGGVRLAMMSPGLVNGQRLSHPDNDPIWRSFVEHEISPAWHVNNQMMAFVDGYQAWFGDDHDSNHKAVLGLFQPVAVQLGLADLAVNGVFERFPDLVIVLAEVGADWFAPLAVRADVNYEVCRLINGRPVNPSLTRRPSELLHEHTTIICSFPSDATPGLVSRYPGTFCFGSDYPHPEGLADPVRGYAALLGELDGEVAATMYGGNIARLLHGVDVARAPTPPT